MTVVDLTTATATEPSSSPRSWTASVLISETTRKGPHWSSTWDITGSDLMSVTRPTNRFRAELATPSGSGLVVA
jgi:hypothetical protein